jgi:hypothetical protein
MKKIYILICFAFLIHSIGVALPITKEVAETRVKLFKHNIAQIQSFNQNSLSKTALKSVEANSMKLEKVTFPDGSSKEITYNDRGQTIDYKYKKFNEGTGTVLVSEHNTISYDGNGNKILEVFNLLRSDIMTNVEKEEYEYDTQNRETVHIHWELDASFTNLIKNFKTTTSYKANGYITEEYEWNEETQSWVLETKSEVELKDGYVLNGSYYYKNEETGVVEKTMIIEVTYDAYGRQSMSLIKAVDDSTGLTVDFMKTVLTYDSNGYEVLYVLSTYDPDSLAWSEFSKTVSVYNSKGQIITEEDYYLDWTTFQLAISKKYEYTYTNDQLTQELVWEKDMMTSQLMQSQKFLFSYDNSIDHEKLILPDSWIDHNDYDDFWGLFYYQFGTLSNVKWYQRDWETTELKLFREATYHYADSGISLDIKNMNVSNFKIGPNPFNENITFSHPEIAPVLISVYNFAGQLVYNSIVNGSGSINTSAWEKGIYMVDTKVGDLNHQRIKLIKR